MATEVHYGTGRRKTSTARVVLQKGSGDITVNKKKLEEFAKRRYSEPLSQQLLD